MLKLSIIPRSGLQFVAMVENKRLRVTLIFTDSSNVLENKRFKGEHQDTYRLPFIPYFILIILMFFSCPTLIENLFVGFRTVMVTILLSSYFCCISFCSILFDSHLETSLFVHGGIPICLILLFALMIADSGVWRASSSLLESSLLEWIERGG